MKRPAALVAPCLALAVAVLACNSDKPKADPDAPKKTTPVPSDMAFNDFLPPGADTKKIAVKVDGGLEAGALATADGTEAAPQANGFKVVEPGAEPRSLRKFAFTQGKVERRALTVRQLISVGGQQQEQPGIVFTADFTVKEAKPSSFAMEMKVVRVDLADRDKLDPRMVQQAAAELGTFVGLAATFDVSPQGDVGELSIAGNPKLQKEGAQTAIELLSHFAELLLPTLPAEPIGVGAKWEEDKTVKPQGVEAKQHRVLELKELGAESGTIVSTITRKVAKRPVNDPRMPRGAMMEVDEKASYTYSFRLDRITTKVVGEQVQDVQLETAGGQGAPGGPRKESMKQTAKHVIEVAK